MTGNAEATRPAAGETVESIRRRSDELEQPQADCGLSRRPASTKVINTPHEALFHQALIRAQLSFETQSHPAGDRWEADIQLHQASIVIEVTNSPGEKRAADRRRRKTEALAASGFRIYWFSNHQARTNADGCVHLVMTENNLVAEENPTVLIRQNRTGHLGNLNPNWGGGVQPTVCEHCGRSFSAYRTKARRAGRARFCSHKCYGDWLHEHPEAVNSKRIERDWSDLASLYEAGMSTYQLAEHYQCSRRAVQIAMRNLDIAPRQQGGYRPRGGFVAAGIKPSS